MWIRAGLVLAVGLVASLTIVGWVMTSCFDCCDLCWEPPPTVAWHLRETGGNWTIEVIYAPLALLPASTYLQVRDPNGVVSLGRTPFSGLTETNWTLHRAQYQDVNPDPRIQVGDALVLDRARYRVGCTFEIADDSGVLARGSLG